MVLEMASEFTAATHVSPIRCRVAFSLYFRLSSFLACRSASFAMIAIFASNPCFTISHISEGKGGMEFMEASPRNSEAFVSTSLFRALSSGLI